MSMRTSERTSATRWRLRSAVAVLLLSLGSVDVASASIARRLPITSGSPSYYQPRRTTSSALRTPAPKPGFVARSARTLTVDGQPTNFVGLNAYFLGTMWTINAGCGPQIDDLDTFFASLPPRTLVRTWAFQSQATHRTTRNLDFRPLDRVVSAAARHDVKLIMTLSDQSGICDDGHWHDAAWYSGGYERAYNDDGRGLAPLPFLKWIRTIVPRYRTSPAVGMWELVNEPEPGNCSSGRTGSGCWGNTTCPPDAAVVMRQFFDRAGGEVKRLDPDHLLASGVMGGSQCGTAGGGFGLMHASQPVDVATFHDYGHDAEALPPELAVRLTEAVGLGKPLLVEEVGIRAGSGATCTATAARAGALDAKVVAAADAGAAGHMFWSWSPTAAACDYNLAPGDPALALLARPRPTAVRARFGR
jgi:hypothetical protein